MGRPKIRPPSIIDSLSFPVFGLTWHGTPATPQNDGVSFTAYCGGGGSAKTGVGNKIVCDLVAQTTTTAAVVRRTVEISTGEALCFGVHAFRPYDDHLHMIRLVACVGDEILLYGIPIHWTDDHEEEEGFSGAAGGRQAILLAKVNVGSGYGANVATYTAVFNLQQKQLQHLIGVGCENGHLVIFQIIHNNNNNTTTAQEECSLTKITECRGHTKAICAIQFHPRGHQVLCSAKDGTARIFSVGSGNELGVMNCEIHDPNGPPTTTTTHPTNDSSSNSATTIKTTDPRMMKRAPQILVRGCAYGDLEGKTMYTIASGKRGAAYLTKWKTLVPLGGGGGGGGKGGMINNNNEQPLNIRQEYRIQCSPVPISATSLSSDYTILALGSVEGSILLYNLETKSVLKQFNEVHDLPVTCLASRPIPNALMLPGELEGGVNFDAVSASADNRMGRWTLQKKSRIKTVRGSSSSSLWGLRKKKGPMEQFVWNLLRIPLLLFVVFIMVAIRDVTIVCREEFGMPAVLLDMGAAGHCLYREVLWAEDTRPGVQFVPV